MYCSLFLRVYLFTYVNMTKIAPHNFVLLIGKLVLRSIMVYQL